MLRRLRSVVTQVLYRDGVRGGRVAASQAASSSFCLLKPQAASHFWDRLASPTRLHARRACAGRPLVHVRLSSFDSLLRRCKLYSQRQATCPATFRRNEHSKPSSLPGGQLSRWGSLEARKARHPLPRTLVGESYALISMTLTCRIVGAVRACKGGQLSSHLLQRTRKNTASGTSTGSRVPGLV